MKSFYEFYVISVVNTLKKLEERDGITADDLDAH
jgi:hypothetical protein